MTDNADYEPMDGDLFNRFERILESDPLIDEIGFIHPSQFALLNEETGSSESSTPEISENNNAHFWLKDHKLGISMHALHPLYLAARNTFMAANRKYRNFCNQGDQDEVGNSVCRLSDSVGVLENEVMKHSRALLLLSCDFGTAWNSRKFILSKKQQLPMYMDEFLLSKLILSYSPKSEQAWNHRRWVIKMIIQKGYTIHEILKKESELVERIAEMSKMNYRAWNHRRWLVSYTSKEQVLNELEETRKWAALHIADNCCFHYRRRLMLRLLEEPIYTKMSHGLNVDIYQVWKEELDWDEMLIRRYIGREALWIHRRFLALYWINDFSTNPDFSEQERETNIDVISFIENELNLLKPCLLIPNNDFDDFEAQSTHSAIYLLWLMKNCPRLHGIELDEKLKACNLKSLLYKASPERCSLWDSLLDSNKKSI